MAASRTIEPIPAHVWATALANGPPVLVVAARCRGYGLEKAERVALDELRWIAGAGAVPGGARRAS